jgi:hypothetical protein
VIDQRVSMASTSAWFTVIKLVTGSMTVTVGLSPQRPGAS